MIFDSNKVVKVHHDLKRRVLEILSLIRVMNNYYDKKRAIQEKIKPKLSSFINELKVLDTHNKDWLFNIPTLLSTINQEFIDKNDSFRFPDSIILFEVWMQLGWECLFPQVGFCFKFPGILRGEKTRYVYQFVFSTSRGIGFPLYFSPQFYEYQPPMLRFLAPLFKWVYKISHALNILIKWIVDGRLNSKRHHPGEFESVIISEFEENLYKGINTLFHGYFTHNPAMLGQFTSIEEVVEKVLFSYRIGDHAMSVRKGSKRDIATLNVPLIDYKLIKKRYEIDFYSYLKKLLKVYTLLSLKSKFYRTKRRKSLAKLSPSEKVGFLGSLLRQKIFSSPQFPEWFKKIETLRKTRHLIEQLKELLWNTPLYSHTVHEPSRTKTYQNISSKIMELEELEYDISSRESIFFSTIKKYEQERNFIFDDKDIKGALRELRDDMAKMWLYFKERHFKSALRKLEALTQISIDSRMPKDYKNSLRKIIAQLIPIMAIYEMFVRSLSNSVYPESVPQTKRIGGYLAKFLTSKYNPLGLNLINLFNRLAFQNWAHLIMKEKLNMQQFFNLIVKLPTWKYIPDYIKQLLLETH
ncbi:MAG: hypothetical protein BAJALOKI1v1_210007 [Promethearchaeota archaeon]|nr:MAG: hypothetical protein BAJALOKI1v1_210007 [Candidatus Lokiarchaeota archaeon]